MTRNEMKTTITLTRIDICDLLIACTSAQFEANDGGRKWEALHDKLKSQLDAFDGQLDSYIENIQ